MRRSAVALPLLLLTLLLAPPPARAAEAARDPVDPAAFFARLAATLRRDDGFRLRFEAEGPGRFRGAGELSFRTPLRARVDLLGEAAPLAWVQNGPRVFLRVGAGRDLPLPAEARATTRLGALPASAAALDAACLALLRDPRARVRSDFTGHELEGPLPGGGAFRIECDRDLVPRSFAVTAPDGDAWRVRFTEFRAGAPDASLFEPAPRAALDLFR